MIDTATLIQRIHEIRLELGYAERCQLADRLCRELQTEPSEQPIGYMRSQDNDGDAFWCSKKQNAYYDKPVFAAAQSKRAQAEEELSAIKDYLRLGAAHTIKILEKELAELKASGRVAIEAGKEMIRLLTKERDEALDQAKIMEDGWSKCIDDLEKAEKE